MNTSKQINPAPSYFSGSSSSAGIPVEVQFRHMRESQRVLGVLDQLMEKFDKYDLPGAKAIVLVDETHHKESTGVFQVKVRLTVPGERTYVARGQEKTGMHDGVYGAMASCFESIERQIVKWHGRRASYRSLKSYEAAA